VLDNPFSQRVSAVVQKTREMRRGVYYPQLYVVKEDGEMPLKLWALSLLIQDRADVMPSYQQFITQLKDKVCMMSVRFILYLTNFGLAVGQWC
jgi:protein transport protein SEC24